MREALLENNTVVPSTAPCHDLMHLYENVVEDHVTSCISDATNLVKLPSALIFDSDNVLGASIFITTHISELCYIVHHVKMSLDYICWLLKLLCAMLISSKGPQLDDKNMTYMVHHVMPCLLVQFASVTCTHDGFHLLRWAVQHAKNPLMPDIMREQKHIETYRGEMFIDMDGGVQASM